MNETALVTGASGGIGYELANRLAEDHYDLVLVARSEFKLNEIADDFRQRYGINVFVIVCDLSTYEACGFIYDRIRANNLKVDILVNNAGMGDWGFFVDSEWEKQEKMLHLNIISLTELTWLFLPDMVKRKKGKILNVASTAAFQPGPLMAVYYATKSYVLSFSLAVANEVKDKGVTVTCFCPGPTESSFQSSASMKEIRLTKGKKIPSSRDVACFGYNAMCAGKNIPIYGLANRMAVFSLRWMPYYLSSAIVRFFQSEK